MKLKNNMILLIVAGCYSCMPTQKPEAIKRDFYEKCRLLVLSEDRTNQKFTFSREVKGIDEINIIYLGAIVDKKKDTLKVLTSVNFSGETIDANRGSGSVYVYTSHNQLLGYYYVGGALSVPVKLENGNIIFEYSNESCNERTLISLMDSIPEKIFINCTKGGGDFYSFTKE